ncbi:hypothetical protein CDL15_Pgr022047 [Punica granatum]|uniref:C3H1-type domain-containing protein n=1 Tax=Punica granatum TaxID=22663 RepID=A0A218VTR1_PUNGR|nr:hypothetical protein CDL15_Pgr022047 [Punica granatum]
MYPTFSLSSFSTFSLFGSSSLPFGSSSSFYQGNSSGSAGGSRDDSFSRGFCKNGSGCKFVHSDDFEGSMSALSGSPSSFNAAKQIMRLKLAHQ